MISVGAPSGMIGDSSFSLGGFTHVIARAPHPSKTFHGDVAYGNLLVENGRLSAIIDFGTSGVGDPAYDLAIAWTLFEGESREALWKALITLVEHINTNPSEAERARRVLDEVLADHKHDA